MAPAPEGDGANMFGFTRRWCDEAQIIRGGVYAPAISSKNCSIGSGTTRQDHLLSSVRTTSGYLATETSTQVPSPRAVRASIRVCR